MTAALLISLRETLETSLVIGIMLAFLYRIGEDRRTWLVWAGVLCGLIISLVFGWALQMQFAGLDNEAMEMYEGAMMFAAAGLLTWMLLWMMTRGKNMRAHIEGKAGRHIEAERPWGIFLLAFATVAREGAEMVIFLQAAFLQSKGALHQTGAVLGILIALGTAYLLFLGMRRIPLRRFFTVTTVLLLLFAAGLVAHGVHEWQAEGELAFGMAQAWNLRDILPDDAFPGSILKGLFGYSAVPSVLEVLAYVGYGVLVVLAGMGLRRREKQVHPA